MSLIVEIAGMIGGMLSEYARSKKWSKTKTFFITSVIFFILSSSYVILFPSEKGVFPGMMAAFLFGTSMGAVLVSFIHIHDRMKNTCSNSS